MEGAEIFRSVALTLSALVHALTPDNRRAVPENAASLVPLTLKNKQTAESLCLRRRIKLYLNTAQTEHLLRR